MTHKFDDWHLPVTKHKYKEPVDILFVMLTGLMSIMMFMITFFPTYGIRTGMAESAFHKAQECVEIPGRVWDHTTSGKYRREVYRHVLKCKGGYMEIYR